MDGESKEKSEIETHHSPNDRINIYYFLNELWFIVVVTGNVAAVAAPINTNMERLPLTEI